ncbi:MAG: L7Ae/L30e/S12e/Gadd45 family ribosomal protein [Gemmatimonadaceae bacterium]
MSKILRLLGLGVRGRLVTVGVDRTREAALKGDLKLAVVAGDVAVNSRDKIVPLLTARGITMIATDSAESLGRAVGRATTAVVGVLDAKLARGIRAAHEDRENLGE